MDKSYVQRRLEISREIRKGNCKLAGKELNMYIPEFVCGIIATLLTEIGISLGYYLYTKKK